MRIRVHCDSEPLRRALTELVREAGHEVADRGEDLRVVVGGLAEPVGPTPALWLLPPAERPRDRDPVRSLRQVLAAGGVAVWPEPLEPSLLLDALDGGSPPPPASAAPLVPPDAPIATSPQPWMAVDPSRGRLLWANLPARRALGLREADFGDALERGVLSGVRPWLERREGRERVEVGGSAWFAVWWTDGSGRRILGLFEPPRPAPSADANVRTLADLGRASATLAHEIRNPVASFAGAIDLLAQDLPARERAEVVSLARARIDQMRALLDDTLRLARPLKGPPVAVDVGAVARSAVAAVEGEGSWPGLRFRLDVVREPVRARGYEQPLHQAVVNLLRNAAQAQPEGEVVLEVRREAGCALLRVVDAGPGIPPEHRERVFEPFFTTKTTGTGLGLPYVRRVVDACGGLVRVEDAERGATIRVELPLPP
jgi:signal transduction histidine kinase